MINAAAHTYTGVQTGMTTLDNFRKMLDLESAAPRSRSIGEVTPTNTGFDHLFHANVQAVAVNTGSQAAADQTVLLDFMRNTSTLRVTVTGLEHVSGIDPDTPIQMFVTARNGRYYFDNSIGTFAREVIYEKPHKELTANRMVTEIKIQRLVTERHLGTGSDPVLLSLRHPATGDDIIVPVNILDVITRNPLYTTQEQIDRESLFEIELALQPLAASVGLGVIIRINEWLIVDLDPGTPPAH
jgi:hypothetical protein